MKFGLFLLCSLVSANLAHSAPVADALQVIGKILVTASKSPEAQKNNYLYGVLEGAYQRAEQLYNYPANMVWVEAGSALDKNNCPNGRLGFAWVTQYQPFNMRSPGNVKMNQIFICPHAQRVSVDDLAQILLHEIFHTNGWLEECDATYYELKAMALANRSAHHNAYVYGCKLERIATHKWMEYEHQTVSQVTQ